MEFNHKNYRSLNKLSNLKYQKELRIKLTKLSNSYFKPRCDHFLSNMRSLNFRILESSGGKKSIDKEVKESRNFRFGKTKDYFIHLTDLAPYKVELSPFINSLKKEFTKEEINIIKKNKDYYIQNSFIKDNISLFNDQTLYEVLNFEEREEEKEKEKKIFHNLNYFNNRRKSVLNLNNSIVSSNNNSFNKSEKKDNKIPLYQTSLDDIKEKKKEKINNVPVSQYLVKKYKLDIIEKDIRKGVKKRRIEDEKINLINEKTKNIVNEMARESQSEINKILNDKNIKKFYNYNYYVTNQISSLNKRPKFANQNKTETSFPLINNIQFLSKTESPIKFKKNFHSSIDHTLKNNFNIIKEDKKDKFKRKISLYKRGKMKELNKKKEENEQIILRDINRKIKSIYDTFRKKNIY